MVRRKAKPLKSGDLQGFKYIEPLLPLLDQPQVVNTLKSIAEAAFMSDKNGGLHSGPAASRLSAPTR
jgi:hypothetical protein